MGCQVPYTSNLFADIRTASIWATDVLWMDVHTVCGFASLGRDVILLQSPVVSGAPVFSQRPTGLEPFHAVYTRGHVGVYAGEEMDNKTQKFLLLPLEMRVSERKMRSRAVSTVYITKRVEMAEKIVRSRARCSDVIGCTNNNSLMFLN